MFLFNSKYSSDVINQQCLINKELTSASYSRGFGEESGYRSHP